MSEHLAWSRLDGRCFPTSCPFRAPTKCWRAAPANIGRVQDALGRQILIENPTHYLDLREHSWSETSFLAELARRSGCGLLIDVNNVAVGAHNVGFDASAWLDAIPAERVGEIHLAGHSLDAEGTLLIDSHDAAGQREVWELYHAFVARIGPRPTLIERDGNVPDFAELMRERSRAETTAERGAGACSLTSSNFSAASRRRLDEPATGAMAVYRNTVLHGAVEALRANYPVVEQIVGSEMFEAVAVDYATECPPRKPGACALRRAFSGLARASRPGSTIYPICPTLLGSRGCTSKA